MLSPDVTRMTDQLTDAYNSVVSLDGFTGSVIDLQIVKLKDDPDWLAPVRTDLDLLRKAAGEWRLKRPEVLAPVLVAITDYATALQSVVSAAASKPSKQEWLQLLETVLLAQINDGAGKLQAAEAELKRLRGRFSVVLPEIDAAIEKGWTELGQEEAEMQDLATQLGNLSAQVLAIGEKIDSDAIAQNKSILTTSVKMLYAAGAAGAEASIPILGIGVAVVTIGKGFYDLIKDADDLERLMRDITALQEKMTGEAQALALTKGTLQTLYQIERRFLETEDAFPILLETWDIQRIKITDAIAALNAGADPEQYIDLIKIADAGKAWASIQAFSDNIAHADARVAPPVVLDIAKAEIKQGALIA